VPVGQWPDRETGLLGLTNPFGCGRVEGDDQEPPAVVQHWDIRMSLLEQPALLDDEMQMLAGHSPPRSGRHPCPG
jgi:hypothetical protein